MEKKYEMFKEKGTGVLYRIRALRDFGYVKKGDIGGYIKKEENLSYEGDCWVFGNACVYDNAHVYGNALIKDYACVYGNALVYDNALVYGKARVYDNAHVYDNAYVYGKALIKDYACIISNVTNSLNSFSYFRFSQLIQCFFNSFSFGLLFSSNIEPSTNT